MGGQSLQALNDQLHPDTLTLGEWRLARQPPESHPDSTPTTSTNADPGSDQQPTAVMGGKSFQALNDQLPPDTLTVGEWRRAQAQERCDSSTAASDDTAPCTVTTHRSERN